MKPEDSASVLLQKHIFPRKMQINVFNKGAFTWDYGAFITGKVLEYFRVSVWKKGKEKKFAIF